MIKKVTIPVLILIVLIFSVSCKKKFGTFDLLQLSGKISHFNSSNMSAFHFEVKGVTLNYIKGSFKKWYFTVYDSENTELFKVSDENYLEISQNIEVQKVEIDLYYDGYLIVKTTKNITGNILDGKIPDRILLRCTIEDQYGNETEYVSMGVVQFYQL
ncbi:MAG: hypothetical protein ABFR75_09125 [Acidobacteriota bacterium]